MAAKSSLEPAPLVYFRQPSLPQLTLIDARRSAHLFRVIHDTFAICVVSERERQPDPSTRADWWYRGRMNTAGPGSTMLMEPGEVHSTQRVSAPADYCVFNIDSAWVQERARELGLRAALHWRLAQLQSRRLGHSWQRLRDALVVGEDSDHAEALLLDAVQETVTECAEKGGGIVLNQVAPQALRRVRDFLHENTNSTIYMRELAELIGTSEFHLNKSFRATYGLPPKLYQTHLRINDVCRQLRAGSPIADVDAPFCDQSHLGRHFRRVVGVTPNMYRAAWHGAHGHHSRSLKAQRGLQGTRAFGKFG